MIANVVCELVENLEENKEEAQAGPSQGSEEVEEDVKERQEREEGFSRCEDRTEGTQLNYSWFSFLQCKCRSRIKYDRTCHLYLSTRRHEEGGQEEELPSEEEEQQSKLNFINVTFPIAWFELVLIGLIS